MSEPRQIGTTPEGYEIWDNGKQSMWAICRKHDWALLEAYGYSGFNTDEKCVGCLIEQQIIKLLEPHRPTGKSVGGFLVVCSCGEAIDDYQDHLIALIKGENK